MREISLAEIAPKKKESSTDCSLETQKAIIKAIKEIKPPTINNPAPLVTVTNNKGRVSTMVVRPYEPI